MSKRKPHSNGRMSAIRQVQVCAVTRAARTAALCSELSQCVILSAELL